MHTPIPLDEQNVIFPLPIYDGRKTRMLELGNKKNKFGTYKAFFKQQGLKHISIDINGKDGAINFDLREKIKELFPGGKWHQYFDIITNIGTTEHVIPQGYVWQNIFNGLAVGGCLVCITPSPGQWKSHQNFGQYPTMGFYHKFSKENHLKVNTLYFGGKPSKELIYARFTKISHTELVTIDKEMIYVNRS